VGGKSFDVAEVTMLRQADVAITHQDDVFTIDADDAMHHITGAITPGEYHQTNP